MTPQREPAPGGGLVSAPLVLAPRGTRGRGDRATHTPRSRSGSGSSIVALRRRRPTRRPGRLPEGRHRGGRGSPWTLVSCPAFSAQGTRERRAGSPHEASTSASPAARRVGRGFHAACAGRSARPRPPRAGGDACRSTFGRPQFPTRRGVRVAFGPGFPSRRGRRSEQRLRTGRRERATLWRGVTRRHSPKVHHRREDQRCGERRPSARRQPACRNEGDPGRRPTGKGRPGAGGIRHPGTKAPADATRAPTRRPTRRRPARAARMPRRKDGGPRWRSRPPPPASCAPW